MPEYDPAGFNIDTFVRRLERAGTDVSNATFHEGAGFYSVDFFMHSAGGENIFASAAELKEDGRLSLAQIRLPTFTVEPDQEGLTGPQYEDRAKSLTLEAWEAMQDNIGEIISNITGVEYEFGAFQDHNYLMRTEHGSDYTQITPHIVLMRDIDGNCVVNKGQLIRIVRELNEMWRNEYFHLEIVERGQR